MEGLQVLFNGHGRPAISFLHLLKAQHCISGISAIHWCSSPMKRLHCFQITPVHPSERAAAPVLGPVALDCAKKIFLDLDHIHFKIAAIHPFENCCIKYNCLKITEIHPLEKDGYVVLGPAVQATGWESCYGHGNARNPLIIFWHWFELHLFLKTIVYNGYKSHWDCWTAER